MREIARWFCENILTMAAIILACIAVLLIVGLLIYLAVIGVCNVIKYVRSKQKWTKLKKKLKKQQKRK